MTCQNDFCSNICMNEKDYKRFMSLPSAHCATQQKEMLTIKNLFRQSQTGWVK